MARPLPRRLADTGSDGLRRALPPTVGILPGLLRGGIPVPQYRRSADGFRQGQLKAREDSAQPGSIARRTHPQLAELVNVMLICDLDGEHDVEDDAAIEHVLSRRN